MKAHFVAVLSFASLAALLAGAVLAACANPTSSAPDYVVSFDGNGGIGTMEGQTIASGTSANLPVHAFTRTGYAFAGWATTQSGTPPDLSVGAFDGEAPGFEIHVPSAAAVSAYQATTDWSAYSGEIVAP